MATAIIAMPLDQASEPDWDQILGEPTLEDRIWWAGHCSHSGWPVDGDLSHEDQCMEALTLSELEYHMSLIEDWPW